MVDEANAERDEDPIDQVAELFLNLLRKNESPGVEGLVKKYPNLAPDLEKRLKLVETIFRASMSSGKPSETPNRPTAQDVQLDQESSYVDLLTVATIVRISCPHCGNKVQVVGVQMTEVTCGSCGSAVRLAPDPTASLSENDCPKQLGRFNIKRVLGEGAFGIVYLANDPKLDREVAIKIPRSGYFPTREDERRFFREAKHAAGLRHPNIVQVHEILEADRIPIIVSDYINGLTLNDLASGGLLSFKETARLLIQVSNAVEFAHQKGVIHRDLKPGNILIDEDRNAYITDFGLARRDDAEITMTFDGVILGTPAYMAPEQAVGDQKLIGRRSDVYSLGVILYRLITQELPFHGTKRMLVHQVVHDEPRAPRSLNEYIPCDLETITLKAMAKSPDDRYQSASELADELQRFLMGEPIRARPTSGFVRLVRWCGRHRAVAALSATIALLLVFWATTATGLWIVADRNAQAAAANDRESSHRLYELLMSNGDRDLERTNLTNASLWFTEALAVQDNANNRTRIAMIQDRIPTLTALWAADSSLFKTAFSEDGTRVAAAAENSIQIFETQTKRQVFDEQVTAYSRFHMSPDGEKFAICGRDNLVQLWNISEQRLIAKLEHENTVDSADFNQSSTKVVSGGLDSFARVWNTQDGSRLAEHKFEGLQVKLVKFVKDTNLVIVVLKRNRELACEIVIWNHESDAITAKGMTHESNMVSVVISSDAQKFCSAESAGVVKVWEISSGDQIGKSIITTNKLYDAFFTGDESLVTCLFVNGEVSTFNYESGVLFGQTIRSDDKLASIVQSPDHSILALSGTSGQVSFFGRESGAQVCTSISNGESANSMAFHPDGHRIAIGGSSGVLQLWDLAGSAPSSFVFQHEGDVRNAIFAPKTNRCLTASMDGKGYIWNALSGERVGDEMNHEGGIAECTVSPDGNLFATAGHDNLVKVWDSLTGAQVGKSYSHNAAVLVVRFNHNGTRIVSGDADGMVRCWEVSASTTVVPQPLFAVAHADKVIWVIYSPDGMTLASTSLDGVIRFWDLATGLPKFNPLKHGESAVYCEFLPDGKRLVSGGADGWVYVWQLETGEVVQRLPADGSSLSVQVLDKGERIISTDIQGKAQVWKADKAGVYSLEHALRHAANDATYSAAYDSRNAILADCGGRLGLNFDEPQSGALILWNLADQRLMAPPLRHHGTIRRVHYSGDLRNFLTASSDKTARIWQIKSASLPVEELQRVTRLYAQAEPDRWGSLRVLDAATQAKEFEFLSNQYPSFFTLDAQKQKVWDYERRRETRAFSRLAAPVTDVEPEKR